MQSSSWVVRQQSYERTWTTQVLSLGPLPDLKCILRRQHSHLAAGFCNMEMNPTNLISWWTCWLTNWGKQGASHPVVLGTGACAIRVQSTCYHRNHSEAPLRSIACSEHWLVSGSQWKNYGQQLLNFMVSFSFLPSREEGVHPAISSFSITWPIHLHRVFMVVIITGPDSFAWILSE